MAKKYYIVIEHPETFPKYFCRFNGFSTPTFSTDYDSAKKYDKEEIALEDSEKLREKMKKERGAEECTIFVAHREDSEAPTVPITESVSKETGWIYKFRYMNKECPARSLWVRYNTDTGNMQAAIVGDSPEKVYEISDDYKEIAHAFFVWAENKFVKGLEKYEREQRANMSDMR